MGRSSMPLLALLAAFSLLVSQSFAEEHVLTLGADTLDAEIGKNDFTLVEFYAPWCGHCKKLTPEYEAAAKQLKDLGSEAVLAKVDVDNEKNKPLAARFGVKGFPTLKIFRKGSAEPEEYNGPREQAGIVAEVLRQSGPASVELASPEGTEKFFGINKVAVVGVFSSFESPEYESFAKSAAKLRASYSFAHSLDATLLPKQDAELAVPGVRLFKDFDGPYLDAPGFDVEALEPFLETKTVPLVVEMSKDPANRDMLTKVFQSTKSKALLFYNYATTDVKASFDSEFRAAAEKYSEYSFVYGDGPENTHATEYFGVKEADLPAIILQDQGEDKKFIKEGIKPADIPKFFEDLKAGLIEPRVKSEEIPEKNDDPVLVVVAKQFNEIVYSGKNVLIEFYAPWCGHCKKLAPIFDKLGEMFKDDADVVIAKMDATLNDVTDKAFDVKGFPTIYFVNAQGKVVLYESGRTKKDFVAYIKKNKTEVVSNASVEDKAEEDELAHTVEEMMDLAPDHATVSKDEL